MIHVLSPRILLAILVSSLVLVQTHPPPCSNIYGAAPCTFLPAPPGKTPPCARPGYTYCEHPDNYPGQRIEYLIQKWSFDHSTILIDESPDEFTSYFYPNPVYHYPYPANNNIRPDSYFPEPIYIPKPPYTYSEVGNRYIPPKNPNNFTGQGQFVNYRYSNDIQVAPQHNYALPFVNNLNPKVWSRKDESFENSLWIRRKRSQQVRASLKLLNSNNSTGNVRRKRQNAGGQVLCPTRSQFVMPRAALNNKGNWMYVVNMPEQNPRYSQLVRSDTCVTSACSGLCQLPLDTTSRCDQKYVQKKLVALDGSGSQLYEDLFWIPSCCICTISNNG